MDHGASPHTILNAMAEAEARAALARCCGASRWVSAMLARRPFASHALLLAAAEESWWQLERVDFLEAFSHHPRIGEDRAELARRFASTAQLSAREQAGAAQADEATLDGLRDANRAYHARFGYIFIVCATGKSAGEMLGALRARLANDPHDELRIAAAEQAKITALRLAELTA